MSLALCTSALPGAEKRERIKRPVLKKAEETCSSSSSSSSSSSTTCPSTTPAGPCPCTGIPTGPSGTPDLTFNPGSTNPGLEVVSMSDFLNLATSVGLQLAENGCDYEIVLGGDAVAHGNPFEPEDSQSGSETSLFTDQIDAFVDERDISLTRLFQNGGVDKSFGPNGNGKFYFPSSSFGPTTFSCECSDQQGGVGIPHVGYIATTSGAHNLWIEPATNNILYAMTASIAASNSYGPPVDFTVRPGTIGNQESWPAVFDPCDSDECSPNDCGFIVGIDPVTCRPYGQTQAITTRILADGSAVDATYGTGGIFALPLQFGTNTLGDFVISAELNSFNGALEVVGGTSPNTDGCLFTFPLLFEVNAAGTATNFVKVEGSGTTSNFTDCTTGENLGFSQYEAVTVDSQGRIIAVGDGDVNGIQWPGTARIIVARYLANGTPDPAFGNNGLIVISALSSPTCPNGGSGKQLLARAVKVDANDDIFIGGDIADINSGPPGATTTSITSPSVLNARDTAQFLLIKLSGVNGSPINFGPLSNCDTTVGTCDSTVFVSCESCLLNWCGGGSAVPFRAVTNDFFGHDDAIFQLHIDNTNGLITATGQAAEDLALQSLRIAFAQYDTTTGLVNPSFGTAGQLVMDGGRNRRSLTRDMVADPCGQLIAAGQSGFSDEEIRITNFRDATEKDFVAVRINP